MINSLQHHIESVSQEKIYINLAHKIDLYNFTENLLSYIQDLLS